MSFFENLLALLLVAIILLQVSRRFSLPYPGLLVLAGVGLALLPGSPTLQIEPRTALALFLAPTVLDAAFDFPIDSARRYWSPLIAFGVVAVIVTTAMVAWIGVSQAGLPIAAAITLGAIVAPPDAAAATATLGAVSIPRSSDAVLRGESLFNDATALLIFGAALSVQSAGTLDLDVGLRLAVAAPGGIVLGIASAWFVRYVDRFVSGTLRGNLLQFVNAYLVWVLADHLQLSAVLAEVAFAMTLAGSASINGRARNRVHSYAVWSTVVFLLNVFAFLLMGMQAKLILLRMPVARLWTSLQFAAEVIATIVIIRLVVVVGFNRWIAWRSRRRGATPPATLQQGILVGWCGMRGLVTLATAFALPVAFPERDTVVVTAFSVVLATLVFQGLSLVPLIKLLRLDHSAVTRSEWTAAQDALAKAGIGSLEGKVDPEAEHLRHEYSIRRQALEAHSEHPADAQRRSLGLAAIAAERRELERLRSEHQLGTATYWALQEELDWRELTLLPEEERRIEES